MGRLFVEFRRRILTMDDNEPFQGEVELDESYFRAKRIRGNRRRGISGKMTVFGNQIWSKCLLGLSVTTLKKSYQQSSQVKFLKE